MYSSTVRISRRTKKLYYDRKTFQSGAKNQKFKYFGIKRFVDRMSVFQIELFTQKHLYNN